MPKTIFSVFLPDKCNCESHRVLEEIMKKNIVASAGTEGRFIIGRHYLTRQQLRNAYYRLTSKKGKENV